MQNKLTQSFNHTKAIILILVLSVFSKEYCTFYINDFGIDFFGYTASIFIFILYLKKIKLNSKLFYFIVFSFLTGLISVIFFQMEFLPFFKTIIPIIIIYLSNYYIIEKNNGRLNKIIEIYIQIAYYAAILGIIQFLFSLIGINILNSKVIGRIDSITYEPSHFAAVILPAVIFTILQIKKYRLRAIVLLLSLIGTISLTSYLAVLIILSIYFSSRIKIIFIIPLFIISFQYLTKLNNNFNERYQSSKEILIGNNDITNSNLTVLSFATNLEVALFSIKQNPIWGSGIGGHKTNYERYYENTAFAKSDYYGFNSIPAHSLFIRIISELGLVGILIYITFFFRVYVKKSDDIIHHIIFLACLSHFVVKFFKLGGYIDYGTPFFTSLIIVNYLVYKSKLKK